MKINLTELLFSLSSTLDFVEMESLGVTSNHGKRVAYISLRIGEKFGFSQQELFDLVSYATMHDNALSEDTLLAGRSENRKNRQKIVETMKEHCVIGEENVKSYPFLTSHKNIIQYHHEKYDGTGFFGLKGGEIPMMAQIIAFANYSDHLFNLKTMNYGAQTHLYRHLRGKIGRMFSSEILSAFLDTADTSGFWLDLNDRNIDLAVMRRINSFTVNIDWETALKLTKVFSKIVDCKSRFTVRHSRGLEEKAFAMANYYDKGKDEMVKLCIAANLHDLGKLTVPNSILEYDGKLGLEERWIMNGHTYYTRTALERNRGVRGYHRVGGQPPREIGRFRLSVGSKKGKVGLQLKTFGLPGHLSGPYGGSSLQAGDVPRRRHEGTYRLGKGQ
jgi:HD-GYP domain-containing protein (c-di-GMP phosphodiesterase class II)